MHEQIFNRIEKKYLITPAQKKSLLSTIKKHMKKDSYYRSTVSNLYFDNDNYDLIIQSIDRPIFKEKLRARSYEGYDRVFLEIKTKLKDENTKMGYKRRVMLTRKEFDEFIKKGTSVTGIIARNHGTSHDIQIAREVDYMVKHFNLRPKILLSYERESYVGEAGLRITFDEKLSYRTTNFSLKKQKHDIIYFKDTPSTIMEIKAHGAIPLWLATTLSESKIFPQQFSKIGKVYEKLNSKKGKNV